MGRSGTAVTGTLTVEHLGAVAAADVGTASSAPTTTQLVNRDVANVRGERILEDLLKVGDSEGCTVLRSTVIPGSPDRLSPTR
jgi:hypothetical protein